MLGVGVVAGTVSSPLPIVELPSHSTVIGLQFIVSPGPRPTCEACRFSDSDPQLHRHPLRPLHFAPTTISSLDIRGLLVCTKTHKSAQPSSRPEPVL
ncbi:unnamed protein product [Protopolystoma xenopodis]|uniref:Uncharacterized protein n=1 Tax=Protopolystoma xenopodis TaxID=117903 RepID=A0A3S5CJ86_9PLAT|nr:unnamed protein product [Protopolystoma xenopodis]